MNTDIENLIIIENNSKQLSSRNQNFIMIGIIVFIILIYSLICWSVEKFKWNCYEYFDNNYNKNINICII
jgi:hypothetical protein